MSRRVVVITRESDVVLLRMQVREVARASGLNLGDQARISLAASSAAKSIGMGAAHPGQATVEECCLGERTGVRVVCTARNGSAEHLPGELGQTKWMVDELTLDNLPANQVQVTLVKWKA